MKHLILAFLMLAMPTAWAQAQHAQLHKLSPMLRKMAIETQREDSKARTKQQHAQQRQPQEVCAFVRVAGRADSIFSTHGCRPLARKGEIYIASIPVNSLAALSAERSVERIEARRGNKAMMDSMAIHLNALPAYAADSLPQAFTGKDVVVGVMDIGFDLTHPNFYDATATHYRISRLWDQLSTDTLGSPLFVGRDYTTEAELLALGCSRDGTIQTHGTHTLGIAAGSGYDSPYRGMAFESDICLVANATTGDLVLIDSADYHKYTYATDALGFKYIFDYAAEVGKPCVISFSEGSYQDFYGYDILYYAMLDSLVGPGRILVASAGNDGNIVNYIRKERGRKSAGTFMQTLTNRLALTAKAELPFLLRTTVYGAEPAVIDIPMSRVLESADSCLFDTVAACGQDYAFTIMAYPSCYRPEETCYDIEVTMAGRVGYDTPLSFQFIGEDTEVEAYRMIGTMRTNELDPTLCDAVAERTIHSPASAPRVICVGATGYRTGITNYRGEYRPYAEGQNGSRASYSSVGPTFDGRTKPDVMAPGSNVISSYSSFYLEHNPEAGDILSDIEHFQFRGRTYPWNSNAGTSMSTPAAAGVIALWLQADPTLTPERTMEVISRTSRHPEPSLEYPNNLYGYGQIDAYRGLLDILGISHIKEISPRQTRVKAAFDGEKLSVVLPDDSGSPQSHLTLSLYSTSGTLLARHQADPQQQEHSWHVGHLPRGIYALQVSGSPQLEGSTLLRW